MNDTVVSLTRKQPQPDNGAFKPGDVIQLRSGGHAMTVRTASKQRVCADWLTDAGELTTAEFTPNMLKHAEPELQEDGGDTERGDAE